MELLKGGGREKESGIDSSIPVCFGSPKVGRELNFPQGLVKTLSGSSAQGRKRTTFRVIL